MAACCSSESVPPPMKKRRVVSAFRDSIDETEATVERAGRTSVEGEAYYSANFKAILSTVLSSSGHERHVISREAVSAVERFMALSESQQQLYVRLFLRKHQWLRLSKLSYNDIATDLGPVVCGLVNEKLLICESQLTDPTETLALLQLGELKALCKELHLPSSVIGSQKSKILESIFQHCRQHKPLFGRSSSILDVVVKKARVVLGRCVRVSEDPAEVFSKLMLLFSLTNSWMSAEDGNNGFSQIIFTMLQANIGKLLYPEYEINVTQPLFSSQDEFDKFYAATREEQRVLLAMEEKDTVAIEDAVRKGRDKLEKELQNIHVDEVRTTMKERKVPLALLSCTKSTDNTLQNTCTTEHSLSPYLLPFTSGWIYAKILSQCVEYLEKQGMYELANDTLEGLLTQEVFCTSSRGRWWDRLALNMDYHLGRKEECLTVIKKALRDPHLRPARRLALLQRAHKLCQSSEKQVNNKRANRAKKSLNKRRLSIHKLSDFPQMDLVTAPEVTIYGRLYQTESKSMYISSSSSNSSCSLVGVEGYAVYHYNTVEGWPCALHAEGSSFTAMFILLMWEQVFSPCVPNIFRSPYQAGPLDLFTEHFYSNRKDIVEARLSWIRAAAAEEISSSIGATWRSNYRKVCTGMNWELFPSPEDAQNLAVCMGGELLSRVCGEFARRSGGGLPDLTLWNPSSKTCKFVEVKGPGDRLSHKQVVWLSQLAQWGCDVEVCRVKAN